MLGSFDPDSLDLYNQLVEAEMPMEYSEDAENYDFARCVRADGTAYGTRGRCRLGTESGPAEKPAPKARKTSKSVSPEKVKDLQNRASRGDKAAMQELMKLRAEGKIGKEPGFAPGQKARNDAKEVANVKAGKSPVADVINSGAKRPGLKELLPLVKEAAIRAKEAAKAYKEAEREFKQAERAVKKDKSKENRDRYNAALRAANAAERASNKADREWDRLSSRAAKANLREERAKMSPERRRKERELDKLIKKMG